MEKIPILVIDDESSICELLLTALQASGYDVDTASNGAAGLAMVRSKKYSLVITDIKMPGIQGIDVLKRIKTTCPDVEVIIITGYASIDMSVASLRGGAFDFINKPFNLDEILLSVERALEKKRLESTVALFGIIKETFTTIDTRALYPKIVNAASRVLPCRDASLMLYEGEKIAVASSIGLSDGESRQARLDLVHRIVTEVIDGNGKGFFSGNVSTDDRLNRIRGANDTASIIVYSLHGKKKCLGALHINRSKDDPPFNERDLQNFSIFASQAELAIENALLYHDLEQKIKNLEQMQVQLVQSEKMASIGQLSAGIAHEINNPIGFITSNLGTLSEYVNDIKTLLAEWSGVESCIQEGKYERLPELMKRVDSTKGKIDLNYILGDIDTLLAESKEGTDRVKSIVINLKDFSHVDETERKYANLNKGLESTLKIIWNELKYKAEVIRDFGELPEILCYPRQLNQVFMNLLINAVQAIPERGTITIRTRCENNAIVVSVADTGAGIPPEVMSRIFDPFFTTKEIGKGTGLGLSISYNIVKKHHGKIDVESIVGGGTTFVITIPVDGVTEEPASTNKG